MNKINTKTLISFKADKNIKKTAQKIAEDMGLTLSGFLNASLKQIIRDKRVVLTSGLVPNEQTEKILKKCLFDVSNKKNLAGPFKNASDMMKSLNK